MSAIRKLIEQRRAPRSSVGVVTDPLADAAEAELKELLDGNVRYTEALERLVERRHESEKRDRADAELLEAWRLFERAPGDENDDGVEYLRARLNVLTVLGRWAAAKGGGR